MLHTISYDVDEKMTKASISQYLYTVHLRPKFASIAVFPLILITLSLVNIPYRDWMIVGTAVVMPFLIIAWVKTFVLSQAQGRDGFKLLSHPTITLNLSDELIEYSSSTGTRRHEWSKIDQFCETKDFMVFQSGRVPLLIIPKAPLSADARSFIMGKTQNLKSPARRGS